jgi:hypothetical protein
MYWRPWQAGKKYDIETWLPSEGNRKFTVFKPHRFSGETLEYKI